MRFRLRYFFPGAIESIFVGLVLLSLLCCLVMVTAASLCSSEFQEPAPSGTASFGGWACLNLRKLDVLGLTDKPTAEQDPMDVTLETCEQEAEPIPGDESGERAPSGQFMLEILPHLLVKKVYRCDTDGDSEVEWIIFHQFDLTDGRSPYAGFIYDSDRGNPPVLFPYQLLPPDRDYLSEGDIRFELKDILGTSEANPVPELFVYGEATSSENTGGKIDTDLTIFQHIPNSFKWESPRDEPRRYQVVGAFRSDGGVRFDQKNETVTVIKRAGYDRSQLALETVYALDEARETYMSATDPQQLGAPISSRVVFAFGMPSDLLNTPYPEKLMLGFYEMLAAKQPAIPPRDFLTGQALIEFDHNNLTYFGFGNVTGKMTDVKEVTVTQLSYAPETEQIDASVTVLGEEPRVQTTRVAFEAKVGKTDNSTPAPIVWLITVVNGKWKIDRRLQ